MFGFPFVTSLVVVTGLVTTLSLITNKGVTQTTDSTNPMGFGEEDK